VCLNCVVCVVCECAPALCFSSSANNVTRVCVVRPLKPKPKEVKSILYRDRSLDSPHSTLCPRTILTKGRPGLFRAFLSLPIYLELVSRTRCRRSGIDEWQGRSTTMLGDTPTTRGRVPVQKARSGGCALKQRRASLISVPVTSEWCAQEAADQAARTGWPPGRQHGRGPSFQGVLHAVCGR
jgi:hypothetical protein